MYKKILVGIVLVVSGEFIYAQCDLNVPTFNVDLTGNPDSVWTSPNITKDGHCCGATNPDKCISFFITLDPGAAGVSFDIISGAVPGGALFYQVNCGPPAPLGSPICLSGIGPHQITFCKPGNNANVYQITSIPSPIGGTSVTVNDGCVAELSSTGYDSTTVVWTSVFPGAQGDYDSLLSCTSGCLHPTVTATGSPPPFVDYMICGQPASQCNNIVVCDTVRVTFNPTLGVTIVPQNPTICFGQTSTTITAQGSGGTAPYSYLWNNVNPSQTNIVGAGTFTVMLSDASGCPPVFATVTVTVFTSPITANAGVDDTVCIQTPLVTLNGSVTGASGGVWSGGNGTFLPNDSTLIGNYIPTASELSNGFVDLFLTTTGNGTCPAGVDTVRINFMGFIGSVNIIPTNVSCYGGSDGSATVNVTGGIPPFTYSWNTVPVQTGSTATNLLPGTYFVTIQNGIGCVIQDSVTITEPLPLSLNFSSLPVSCFGGNDGSLTASAVGGTSPYSYLWSPGGQITASITGQTAGIYTVTVTDSNGCVLIGSDTIIEPLPLALILTQTNVSCFGGNDGTINTTVSGGTPSYSYSWSPSGGSSPTASGLLAGSYVVTITDANNCILTDSVVITEPLLPVLATTVVTDVSCFGGSDGSVTVTPSGGTSPYSYSWLPGGQTTATINGQAPGTYTIIVTDTNGCSYTAFATINNPIPIQVSSNQSNVSCFGGSNAVISLNVSGGTPGYSYLWSPGGATTANLTNVVAGTYIVQVTDTNGCQEQDTVVITEPTLLTVLATPTPTSCFGGSDGTVSALGSGGTSPYTYSWLPGGQTTGTIVGQIAGVYTVTVTDSNGCTATNNAVIVEPAPINIVFTPSNVSCFGGSDGTVSTVVTGGTTPYSYSWSPLGGSSPTASGLLAGTYSLTVTDSNSCVLIDSITIAEPLLPVSAISSITNVSCFGGSDGSVTVTPSGGTSPYTYLWSPGGQNTATISGQIAGTYTVTVTDSNGCTTIDTAIITEPTAPGIIFNFQVNVSCFGGNDGAASATGFGGTPNYTYSWLPGGATTNTVSGLTAGTYTLTLTDNNGCQVQSPITIVEPTLLTVSTTPTSTSCFGGSDGTVSALGSGGISPYSYSWLPGGQTTGTIVALSAGVYTVTITDSNGCTATDNATIVDPAPIVLAAGAINSACGLANGLAFVSITSGGTGPFTYLWSPLGGTNDTASGLFAGSYTVVVTDVNGCTASATGNVNDNASAVPTISATTNVSCPGGADGTATVTHIGGVGPFTYQWSPFGGTNATATGLSTGIYTVAITGSNGCQSSITTPLIIEPNPIVTSVTVTDVSCFGGNDGTATATSLGGTPGYSYQWLPSGATGPSISNLTSGMDSVVTTDTNGCTQTTTFMIAEPLAPISAVLSATPVSCFGGNDGTATAVASGGTGPYTYNWMPGNIGGSTASALAIGTYVVTITDINGCILLDSITVIEPTQIALTPSSINSTCGLANGQASVAVVGGIAPYTYLWSPFGGTNATATGLLSGLYVVTVNDSNGCNQQANITINNTPGPTATISATTNVSCFGGNDGTATATAVGGTTPYTYLWNPIGGTGVIATGLATGIYTVIVIDSNGCQANTTTPLITEPNLIVTLVTVTNVSCFGGNDGTATAISIGGTPGYSYQWLPSGTIGSSISNLTSGMDSVITTDTNGCSQTTTFMIAEPNLLAAVISSSSDVSCFGGNDGIATVVPNGGTPFYSYSWSPTGGNAPTAVGLSAGLYTVTITDFNGCTVTANVTINEPAQALTATASISAASCFGSSTGAATINPTGGTPGYSYTWFPIGGTSQTETGLSSGNYTVLVADTNGCQTNVALTILQPPALLGSLAETNPSCGLANGSISVLISGGTTPYTYLWTPGGAITSTVTGLNPGNYSVDITDSAGCVLTLSTTLINIPGPSVTIPIVSNVSCFGGNDGNATANITAGTAPYLISWSPFGGTNLTANSLTIGAYTVTVTDSLGCIAADSVVITEPTPISINVISLTNVTCNGGDDGTISISAFGGTGSYTYSWSPNTSILPNVNNLSAGSYVVTVTDANGCSAAISINITEPALLVSAITSTINPTCFTSTNGSSTVSVTGGTAPYTYLWSNGQTGSTANNLVGGVYNVTITDTNGCMITNNIVITQPNPVVTNAGINDTICLGQSGVVDAFASGGTGPYSYSWQPTGVTNSGTLNVTPLVSTEYTVVAFDQNGCPGNLDTVLAIIYSLSPDNIQAVAYSPICPGQTSVVYVDTSGTTGPLTYSWNNGLGSGPGGFIVTPTQPTTYVVTVTNSCGVSVTDSVQVIFNPPPFINLFSDIDSACVPALILFSDSSITGNSSDPIISWNWDFGDSSTSTSQNPSHLYQTPGNYQVVLTVTTLNGCTNNNTSAPLMITIFPKPIASFSVNSQNLYLPNDVLTTTNTSIGATNYNWNFGDGSTSLDFEPNYLYTTIGVYQIQLIATNQYGCNDTAGIEIETHTDLIVPNAFTPNNGGSSGGYYDVTSLNNDIFFPYASGVVEFKFQIFNRWGELVFATNQFEQGWDGYYKGVLVEQGVYIWKIYAKLNNDKVFNRTGDVTLLR